MEVRSPDDQGWGQVQREIPSRALSRWSLVLSGTGIGGLFWARGLGPFGRWGPPGWPRMWGRGRKGPTLVLYLLGAEKEATEAWGAAAASIEPTTGLPWVAAMVAIGAGMVVAVVVAAAMAETGGPELEPQVGGGEECLTLGRKLFPLCVFNMARVEKEMRWRGCEEGGFLK